MESLFRRLASVFGALGRDLEILVMDDCSPDATGRLAQRLAMDLDLPVRVHARGGPRSMGRAIVEGIRRSDGDLVCVIDADLSHPPETIPDLLQALDGADGVIASRYVAGGAIIGWTRMRRIVSWGATALSRPLIQTACRDPLSGFFLFRRSALAGLAMTGIGNKPLLEILSQRRLIVHEIPYAFHNREHGMSKLGPAGFVDFSRLLGHLVAQLVRAGSGSPRYPRDLAVDAQEP